MRVLYVDDEPLLLRAFARLLRSHGVAVDLADSAEAALDYFNPLKATKRPDALVTDLEMPGAHGAALISYLRLKASWCGPMVLLSAAPDVHERGAIAGATATLEKPATAEQILKAIGWTT